MKCSIITILFLSLCSGYSFGQPRYSPELRTERTMKWMHDSLHISPAQQEKLNNIELNYQRSMDKANEASDKRYKGKKQKQLMRKKDADVKAILKNERLYRKYYRREQEIRSVESRVYTGPHQPL